MCFSCFLIYIQFQYFGVPLLVFNTYLSRLSDAKDVSVFIIGNFVHDGGNPS